MIATPKSPLVRGINMTLKSWKCPACGAALKLRKYMFLYDAHGEIMNGNVYTCKQCAVTVLVPF
jgi:predicted RNA-binding Zn-ribbon protein involved in translation (DUF1610 family)